MNEPDYLKMFRLDGKIALVTGAAGIIGSRVCHGLSQAGAKVIVCDINIASANELVQDLSRNYPDSSYAVQCDVSSRDSVIQMSEHIQKIGIPDILFNNAAGKSQDLDRFFAPFEDYDPEQWNEIMNVNLGGMFLVAQAVGKLMQKFGRPGSIVQTSSIYGSMGPDQRIYEGSNYMGRQINTPAVYSASKGAVESLTRYLATYWAKDGIRVNTISPGGMYSGQNEEFCRRYSNRIPMNRMGNPQELVGAVLFLASSASSYVTGHNLMVDGGLSAW